MHLKLARALKESIKQNHCLCYVLEEIQNAATNHQRLRHGCRIWSEANMIRAIVDRRFYVSLILSIGIGLMLKRCFPFPSCNAVVQLTPAEKRMIFLPIQYAY